MDFASPVTLQGAHVRLRPLAAEHAPELAELVDKGGLHRLWYTTIAPPAEMGAMVAERLAHRACGQWLPFVVESIASGRLVGCTNYLNIDGTHRRLEIGGTFYAPSVQRSAVNTECKLLLLTHAFEALDCIAVEFRTHRLNHASRAAIERLGAQFDGVLRNHQLASNGTLRDTAVYSITSSEWPTVKTHLRWQLDKPR